MFRSILCLSIAVAAECLMVGNSALATIVYSEDWSSGTNGQSITSAPFSYSAVFGSPTLKISNSTPGFGPSLAVDGTGAGALATDMKDITPPTLNPGTQYSMTVQAYAKSDSSGNTNLSYVGISKNPAVGAFNSSGVYVGLDNGYWDFDPRGVGGGGDYDLDGSFKVMRNEVVTISIVLDIVANSATATITDGVTTLSKTVSGGLDFSGLHRFALQERSAAGLDIGSVLIQETTVPEPAAALLFVCGGIALAAAMRLRSQRVI